MRLEDIVPGTAWRDLRCGRANHVVRVEGVHDFQVRYRDVTTRDGSAAIRTRPKSMRWDVFARKFSMEARDAESA